MLAKLPLLKKPMPGEVLCIYLSMGEKTVSFVLIWEEMGLLSREEAASVLSLTSHHRTDQLLSKHYIGAGRCLWPDNVVDCGAMTI